MLKRLIIYCMSIISTGGFAHAGIFNGNANVVLGHPDFSSSQAGTAGGAGLNRPSCVTVDNTTGRVFVADTNNNRVVWWNSSSGLASGAMPDGVLGQADLNSVSPNRGGGVHADTLSRAVQRLCR